MASATSFVGNNSGFQAGFINGPANTEFHYHLPPERSETPPNPSAVIPFARDLDFVERGGLLDQIHQKCAVSGSRTALVGLGGVGKSQLAIEYGYRVEEQSPGTWVFWVHAGSSARLEQGFQEIADHVKILGRKDPKANVLKLVCDWLRNRKNGEWVLILDNIDDIGLLSEAGSAGQGAQGTRWDYGDSQSLSAYLPQSPNGRILITSRNRGVALELVEEREIIAIDPMAQPHALALLKKKLGVLGNTEDVAELAAVLEYMPLAIVQAAAYISRRAPRCSVGQYLEDFRKSDSKKTNLLDFEGGKLRRDREAKNAILITWQISFGHIQSSRSSAADLLSLMSFFDRQGIPDVLVRHRAESRTASGRPSQKEPNIDDGGESGKEDDEDREDTTSLTSENDEFEDDIQILRDYSFISSKTDRAFEMHALVQLAMQKWLKASDKHEKWKDHYIRNLSAEFPDGEYENWTRCEALFPHAKQAATQQPSKEGPLLEWALLLYNAAWYAWRKEKFAEAIRLSSTAMKVRRRILGREHEETLNSMRMMGLAYSLGGRWKEAEELEVRVMEASKKVLGEKHPSTLRSMNNLALVMSYRGKYEEAERMHRDTLVLRKEELGKEHLSTVMSMNNLALAMSSRGKYEEAERMHRDTLALREEKLGKEHPHTLLSINNLASVLNSQGRYEEAERIHRRELALSEIVLGEKHPSTLTSMNNLAEVLSNQGKYEEAERIHQRQLALSEIVLGEEHPHTLTSMNNLAKVLSSQGKYEEAERRHREASALGETELGKEHPFTLTSKASLASIFWNQRRWKEAEELEVQVIETRKKVLGEEHPDTLTITANLASTYQSQGRWKEAEELEVQVLETRKKVLGQEHPDTLTSMNNLASVLRSQNNYEEAERIYRETLALMESVLGKEHPSTLTSVYCLAYLLHQRKHYDDAKQFYHRSYAGYRKILGENHPTTAACRRHYSSMLEEESS